MTVRCLCCARELAELARLYVEATREAERLGLALSRVEEAARGPVPSAYSYGDSADYRLSDPVVSAHLSDLERLRAVDIALAAASQVSVATQGPDWGTHDVRLESSGRGRYCARCGLAETTCYIEGLQCRPLWAGQVPYASVMVLGSGRAPGGW